MVTTSLHFYHMIYRGVKCKPKNNFISEPSIIHYLAYTAAAFSNKGKKFPKTAATRKADSR